MVTTRRQSAISEGKIHLDEKNPKKADVHKNKRPYSTGRKPGRPVASQKQQDIVPKNAGGSNKRHAEQAKGNENVEPDGPLPKKAKLLTGAAEETSSYKIGTIERGHIYFLYRPRVEVDEVHSIDDIRNFHMLLVPRPPASVASQQISQSESEKQDPTGEHDISVLKEGADAVPAPAGKSSKKYYRLVTVGKKKLPDSQNNAGSSNRKNVFYATVTAVGYNTKELEKGLGEKFYETKTRGTRHEGPVRLVARGGYAIVNSEGKTPSQRETHLGYHVSHPPPADLGEVQTSLGIFSASSFILQVKNPLAPATGSQQARSKGADYPSWIMHDIFGKGNKKGGQSRGRESYGLRFASCETPELLDYKGAELLLIASRDGEEGLETSLGEGRGKALSENEEKEAHETVSRVFEEIGLDFEKFPVESLQGSWI